jgi:hypothetical protein
MNDPMLARSSAGRNRSHLLVIVRLPAGRGRQVEGHWLGSYALLQQWDATKADFR